MAEQLGLARELHAAGLRVQHLAGLCPQHLAHLLDASVTHGLPARLAYRRARLFEALTHLGSHPRGLPPLMEVFRDPALAEYERPLRDEDVCWERLTAQPQDLLADPPAPGRTHRTQRELAGSIGRLHKTSPLIGKHARREKTIGRKTQYERRRAHYLFARELRALGHRLPNIRVVPATVRGTRRLICEDQR
ncbi:hypothetical protein [Thiocystis violacea]|uniref:hypothetical protein n=1 Tax=Thiocystis violacea TaxID=13725 RepID=UPI001903223A|nr:hypothetical protein [Thiocystis violacea]